MWNFTDVEFKVLWERHSDSPLPPPMVFLSRTPMLEDFEREKYGAWQHLQATLDSSFDGVLETLLRPDVFVVLHGWNDREMENPHKRIRLYAARSGLRGYVLTQLPGETVLHSGGYTITECDPRALADAVVRAMPTAEAGRRFRNVPIAGGPATQQGGWAESDQLYRPGGSLVSESVELGASSDGLSERFFAVPATMTGGISVSQGRSKYGRRGILEEIMVWRDLPDDGRYVFVLDHAPTAMGIGSRHLTVKLAASIDRILERMETHREWEVR
ncbi:ESX secretion-associated protein EspG [Nocardia sp. CDC159]|uniref:ESX secretion-associated protein EspG n=1 Tax=Nocardia pulmonis TaxID=2951408 RepID=A0A9X2J0L5_9NOCA|nr:MULTISPECIES: ESX secretion-associated protein EspG [Nocardia]MCM6776066.1 ESX secretion-associated protein EspG [Nocardia pulmonis]MCM6788607.1 ESX secretion-associated protein EspG [Nocardia sp. CDC159]